MVCVCMNVHVYIAMAKSVLPYVPCMYICMYLCIYVCTYTYLHTQAGRHDCFICANVHKCECVLLGWGIPNLK